jgi:hypothetical protein
MVLTSMCLGKRAVYMLRNAFDSQGVDGVFH